jgi:hypothetical protein
MNRTYKLGKIFEECLYQSSENSSYAFDHISDRCILPLFLKGLKTPPALHRHFWSAYCLSSYSQAPIIFSKASCLVLHSMQRLAIGLALRRLIEISLPQSSQIPYSPLSISSRDFLILLISMLSRSRIRRFVLRSDSIEAQSK